MALWNIYIDLQMPSSNMLAQVREAFVLLLAQQKTHMTTLSCPELLRDSICAFLGIVRIADLGLGTTWEPTAQLSLKNNSQMIKCKEACLVALCLTGSLPSNHLIL